MVVPPTDLSALRAQLRMRRLALAAADKVDWSERASLVHLHVTAADIIGLYLPVGGEPDPFALIDRNSCSIALPAMEAKDALMTFRSWSPGHFLGTAPWGGRQPATSAIHVVPDLIFVPVLAFDVACNRIGQGGGHFDRYLARHPQACRIGIAWDGQRIDSIAARPWDVPMDAILTETHFYIKDLDRCNRPQNIQAGANPSACS